MMNVATAAQPTMIFEFVVISVIAGIEANITNRTRSQTTIVYRRFHRSATTPATGPRTSAGSIRTATTEPNATPSAADPVTWVDANTALPRRPGKPIRVASKSVRCRSLLRRALATPGWHAVMAYTLAEALWLAKDGISDDILVAYPTADRAALRALAADEVLAGTVTLTVDSVEHLDLIDAVAGHKRPPVRVCLELDASWRLAGGRIHL